VDEKLVSPTLFQHHEESAEIPACAVEVNSILPVELSPGIRPILAKRPSIGTPTQVVDPQQHLLDIGRERMLTVKDEIGQWIVSRFPVWHWQPHVYVDNSSSLRPLPPTP
jgi:hypothetical protein